VTAALVAAWLVAMPFPASTQIATAAEALPSALSDAEFWSLVERASEPEGNFPYDNFLSNETTIQSVIPALQMRTEPGGAYLGVGPEQNFTYIAALKPKIAFIIDIRRQNLVEHLMYKALFELAADRAEFVSRLFARPRPPGLDSGASAARLFHAFDTVPRDRQLFDATLRAIVDTLTVRHGMTLSPRDRERLQYVYSTFFEAGPGLNYASQGTTTLDPSMPTYIELMTDADGAGEHHSYLATEDRFRFVKELEAANLVIPVVGDFAGPTALREVGQYLSAHGATVTAFYLSNVERYLFDRRRTWRRFYANVATLPYDDQSLFIRAILNRPASTLVTLLSPIAHLIQAFEDGRVREYQDVFSIANY
jgi:hypothetical protein